MKESSKNFNMRFNDAFMIRLLRPWFENMGKRLVRSPKLYVRDSGLLHALMGIGDHDALLGHPKLSASWEGFALEEILQAQRPDHAWFAGFAKDGAGRTIALALVVEGGQSGATDAAPLGRDIIGLCKEAGYLGR